ncbi:MAG: hypothetical protein II477_08875 [Lachnospiraceae bacterium]|jgi:hypothetical protein|nr:hypothetical protein [Lachnospiraceae bacterium]MBQ2101170.1 hypothetical protein [Lachnospiraceae bacterium]MBQ3906634.1 hypothetical protein [Lachnospiraceae bacterium]
MIYRDKVILMTRLAAFEQKNGKKFRKVNEYYRGDYIVIQLFKAVVSVTIAFAVVFGLYIFYDFENFMQDIYKMDLLSFAKNVLTYYAIALVAYLGFAYIYATVKYFHARKSLNRYYNNLKKLNAFYNWESKNKRV